MGKHSIQDKSTLWRSAGEALRPWLVLGLMSMLAIVGWRAVASGNESEGPSKSPSRSSSAPARAASTGPGPTKASLPTSGRAVKVQVLNGTTNSTLGPKVAQRLRKAGFDVVAVGTATEHYDRTVLFCLKGFAKPGGELADLLHIKNRKLKPANLDPSIPLTVVIGDDYEALHKV